MFLTTYRGEATAAALIAVLGSWGIIHDRSVYDPIKGIYSPQLSDDEWRQRSFESDEIVAYRYPFLLKKPLLDKLKAWWLNNINGR
jgi:hypothetical protein